MTIFYYIINQKRIYFMEHRSPPWYKTTLIPNTCINIVNIMWKWGLVSREERCCSGKKKTENVAFWTLLFYINNRVLSQFLCTILHDIWQIPLFLSNYNLHMERITHFYKFKVIFCVFAYFKKPCHYCVSLYLSVFIRSGFHTVFALNGKETFSISVQSHLQVHRWCIVHKQPRIRKLSGPDVSCWTWDQGHNREHHFCFLPRFTTVDWEGWSTSHFDLRQTRWFQFPHHKLSVPE